MIATADHLVPGIIVGGAAVYFGLLAYLEFDTPAGPSCGMVLFLLLATSTAAHPHMWLDLESQVMLNDY